MASQHADPQLNVRPPAAVMEQAKDTLQEHGREIRGFVAACLAALNADPDTFLAQLAEHWPPEKRRGRPRRTPATQAGFLNSATIGRDDRMDEWLATHRRALAGVGEMLVDHRDHLLGLLTDPGQQQQLAEAIDRAGELLSTRPRLGFAGAVAYAVYLLRPDGPAAPSDDPVVREGLASGMRLRASFEQALPTR